MIIKIMEEALQPFVFISYSRKDSRYADALAKGLRKCNVRYFLDRENIKLGQPFPEATAGKVRECDLFVLLWSQYSSNSHFVKEELNIALASKKMICPVLLEADLALPDSLAAIHAVTCTRIRDMEGLADRLKDLLPRAPAPPPPPPPPNRSWIPWLALDASVAMVLILLLMGVRSIEEPEPKPKLYQCTIIDQNGKGLQGVEACLKGDPQAFAASDMLGILRFERMTADSSVRDTMSLYWDGRQIGRKEVCFPDVEQVVLNNDPLKPPQPGPVLPAKRATIYGKIMEINDRHNAPSIRKVLCCAYATQNGVPVSEKRCMSTGKDGMYEIVIEAGEFDSIRIEIDCESHGLGRKTKTVRADRERLNENFGFDNL